MTLSTTPGKLLGSQNVPGLKRLLNNLRRSGQHTPVGLVPTSLGVFNGVNDHLMASPVFCRALAQDRLRHL